jgi:hypothetical protein
MDAHCSPAINIRDGNDIETANSTYDGIHTS